ncbi:MAG: hypothetical protein M1835_006632 [Candelina submexicana]|nr:MAG: hypothetical protein M1835_006632 [Candelina submexicana]
MCIVLVSTAHPSYPLILIDNRDEFLDRPTAPASYWPPPNNNVLAGRDLLRSVHGTWLGVTKEGRIAVLTNFREEGDQVQTAKSRGLMVKAFLTVSPHSEEDTEDFVRNLIEKEGVQDMGGFSLVCGKLRQGLNGLRGGLAVVSNRTPDVGGVTWIATSRNETHGLSNTAYGDRTWPKVLDGERLMREAIQESVENDEEEDDFIERLFRILSIDTLPRTRKEDDRESWVYQLRNSIFIPAVTSDGMESSSANTVAAARSSQSVKICESQKEKPDSDAGVTYGTQKQTVILVNEKGILKLVERTLYDEHRRPLKIGKGDRRFDFVVADWLPEL